MEVITVYGDGEYPIEDDLIERLSIKIDVDGLRLLSKTETLKYSGPEGSFLLTIVGNGQSNPA